MGIPVLRRSTEPSYLSLGTEPTYRSLGTSSLSPVPLPLSKGGPDSAWQEVDRAEVAFPSKEAVSPISVSSVSKSFGSLDLSSLSSLSSVSSSQPQPRPILDCPVYYEPNSSFFAKKSPSEIFDAVIAQLKKRDIGYEFDKFKNKIKGVITNDNSTCTFRVNLFKAPENAKKAKFLVEVQRRFGCCVVFRRFYQQFLQALATEGVAIPFSPLPLKPAAAAYLQPAPAQVTLDKTSLDLLFRSLGNPSKFGTVSLENLREALRVLANLSSTSKNKEILVDAETDRSILFEILLSALKLSDGEVRRCSATLLNNIATLKTIRSELITKLATCMFQTLDNTSDVSVAGFMSGSESLIRKESQRQIAQALVTLTETHAVEMALQPNYPYFQEVLTKHKTSSDDLLRESVQAAIANLS
jgi:DNA-binding transcriptional ArsR family regulator